MENITAKKAAFPVLTNLYDFHTKLYYNVLVDISEEDAAKRLNTRANHMAWIAGSLVTTRYELAKALGIEQQQKTSQLFENNKGIQESVAYPTLAEFRQDWESISTVLKDALANMTEEQLNGPDPFGMPGENVKIFDSIMFMVDRESYCIGQLGLWRRLLGYDAMKYD